MIKLSKESLKKQYSKEKKLERFKVTEMVLSCLVSDTVLGKDLPEATLLRSALAGGEGKSLGEKICNSFLETKLGEGKTLVPTPQLKLNLLSTDCRKCKKEEKVI